MERAHLAVSVVALVACSSESTSQLLDSYEAQTQIVCGSDGDGIIGNPFDLNGCLEAPCMNNALSDGVVAEVSLNTVGEHWYQENVYVFTVGKQVKIFTRHHRATGLQLHMITLTK